MDKDTRKWISRWVAAIIVLGIAVALYRAHSQTATQVTQIFLQKVLDAFNAWPYIVASLVFGFLYAEWRRGSFSKK